MIRSKLRVLEGHRVDAGLAPPRRHHGRAPPRRRARMARDRRRLPKRASSTRFRPLPQPASRMSRLARGARGFARRPARSGGGRGTTSGGPRRRACRSRSCPPSAQARQPLGERTRFGSRARPPPRVRPAPSPRTEPRELIRVDRQRQHPTEQPEGHHGGHRDGPHAARGGEGAHTCFRELAGRQALAAERVGPSARQPGRRPRRRALRRRRRRAWGRPGPRRRPRPGSPRHAARERRSGRCPRDPRLRTSPTGGRWCARPAPSRTACSAMSLRHGCRRRPPRRSSGCSRARSGARHAARRRRAAAWCPIRFVSM